MVKNILLPQPILSRPTSAEWQVKDFFGKLVNSLLGIDRGSFTQSDLSVYDLKRLDEITDSIARTDYPQQYRKLQNDSIPFSINIEGPQYQKNYGGARNRSTLAKIFTPQGHVENTLGDYRATLYPEGNHYTDVYDFSDISPYPNGLYSIIRSGASKFNTSDTARDYEKANVNVVTIKNNENKKQNRIKQRERQRIEQERIDELRQKSKENDTRTPSQRRKDLINDYKEGTKKVVNSAENVYKNVISWIQNTLGL